MTTGAASTHTPDLPLPEQDFVDAAYERLDSARFYQDRQGPRPSTHGVTATHQAWTEREALCPRIWMNGGTPPKGRGERLVFGRLDMVDASTRRVGAYRCRVRTALPCSWTRRPSRALSTRRRRRTRWRRASAPEFGPARDCPGGRTPRRLRVPRAWSLLGRGRSHACPERRRTTAVWATSSPPFEV